MNGSVYWLQLRNVVLLCFGVILVSMAPLAIEGQSARADVPPFLIGDRIDVIERVNVSLHEDGRYAGHLQRERRLLLQRTGGSEHEELYSGEFIATENTIHDLRTVASRIDSRSSVDATFDGGRIVPHADTPLSRGVPTIPTGSIDNRGWESPAFVTIDTDTDTTRAIPTVVAYQPRGIELYQGEEVFRIEYGFSLEWPRTQLELEEHPAVELITPDDLPEMDLRIRGNRQGVILLPLRGGVPVLHRTNLEERIVGSDGTTIERRGFILTWYRTTPVSDGSIQYAREAAIPDVTVEQDKYQRLRLSIQNLQFVADQDTLLPGEAGRLDQIAELLSNIEESTILVTGHTADIGSQESQQRLSVARARRIVEAFIDRGIPPGRLRYEGVGGTQPIGDNTSESGRAKNRRVEITILPN